MTERRRGFPVGLTVTVAIALAILIGLGTWQVQRLHWKEGLLARIAALQGAPAQDGEPVLRRLAQGGDVDFTRIYVGCSYLRMRPYIELYALRDGQAGWRLISACPVVAGPYRSILVDRGFIPDTRTDRPDVRPPPSPTDIIDELESMSSVTGVLRRPDRKSIFAPQNQTRRWFSRDIAGMAKALGAVAPAPVFLMAESSAVPDWTGLVPAPIPADIPNNHLGYAITWYGLAAALLGVYAALLWKRRTS